MSSPFVVAAAGAHIVAQGQAQVNTSTLQQWITGNIVPLLLLGIAVSGKAPDVGKFFAGLITG